MSITFYDLLTDPKYRDMDFESFYKLWHSDEISLQTANESCSKLGFSQGLKSRGCWEHLQKLKAESEKKAEPIVGFDKSIENFWNPIHKSIKFTPNEPSIQITDQKAREICAKYFNCPPNEIKILHP